MTKLTKLVAVVTFVASAVGGGESSPQMYVVHLPIQSYRLLAMSMDDEGYIWFGSIHQVIHRYDPRTGAVKTISLPKLAANYPFWANDCLAVGDKVYVLGEKYPRLLIYDRATHEFFEREYPSAKPDVWYGLVAPDKRFLYLFDRGSAGIIKWDSATDTGRVIPYPYRTILPSFGRYVPADHAIWCGIWDYSQGQYVPVAITRFDVENDQFTGVWHFPDQDKGLHAYSDPDSTLFFPWTLKGELLPFDYQTKRWCKFVGVPRFGRDFGFIGLSTPYQGLLYFSLSTYNGREDLGTDGKPYHFLNRLLSFDPSSREFGYLTLDVPGKYHQIAYTLSANGNFYATGSNILRPDGTLFRENRGDIVVWQTQRLQPQASEGSESRNRNP